MTRGMFGKDECLYLPGDLITAKHMGSTPRGPEIREEIGLVLAVVHTGSMEMLPSYLILWEWRGLLEHEDGHLATFGTSRA